MKKILALVLTLVMLMVSTSALASEAAYSYTEYTYDETLFTDVAGSWIAMEGLGLVFYLPDIYLPIEVSEEAAQLGIVGLFGTEDSLSYISVSYGPALDVNGNPAASIEDLAAYVASVGFTSVDVIIVNGIPMVTAVSAENDTLNYSVFFEDGTQCILTFSPASDTATTLMGALLASSVMAAEIVA